MFRFFSRSSKFLKPSLSLGKYGRNVTTNATQNNVCVVGAGGGIGQPLSLLLKYNSKITELHLVDVADISGIGVDLSHIDTSARVYTHPYSEILTAMESASITVIVAGMPRKPGMTRDDLFKINADIIGDIIKKIAELNQSMHVAIVTNPVNSILPFAYNLYAMLHPDKAPGKMMQKFYGVTCLDSVRANTFYSQKLNLPASEVIVPVVGGHSDTTIIPLLSQSNHPCIETETFNEIMTLVREAGTKVVEAKKGAGSATLSMAYAANRFVNTLLDAHTGTMSYECAFVPSPVRKDLAFFAEICCLNVDGCTATVPLENITEYENKVIQDAIPILIQDTEKGLDYSRVFYKNGPQNKR